MAPLPVAADMHALSEEWAFNREVHLIMSTIFCAASVVFAIRVLSTTNKHATSAHQLAFMISATAAAHYCTIYAGIHQSVVHHRSFGGDVSRPFLWYSPPP
jgi:hypothetical protein